ncbi:MAG: hypothetical protein ABR927_03195 [Bacteroidales bacterium]|jgi:hypothetical protein
MKKAIAYFLSIFCLIFTQAAIAQQKNTLRYEIMLNNKMLEPALKKDHFIGAIDISQNKYITLSTGHKFYILGWGGISQFGKEADSTISSYAFASDGLLMAVKDSELCYMNDKGSLVGLVKLPGSGMGIAEGKDVMYLFDQNRNDKQYRLYAFARGGKYKQLLVSPKPVTTAAEMNDSLYLAIGSGVFSFSPKGSKLNLVAGFQKDNEIKSMTVDSANSILYIATKDAIYALQNESLVYVTGDFGGGIIKFFSDGLIIFNPETCDIIRIVNISKSIIF